MAEAKWEKRKQEERPNPDKIDKVKAIMDSAMPEEQKQAYLREIGVTSKESLAGKVGLDVYFTAKKVDRMRHGAMRVYPGAKNVKLATIEEWDGIFKDF